MSKGPAQGLPRTFGIKNNVNLLLRKIILEKNQVFVFWTSELLHAIVLFLALFFLVSTIDWRQDLAKNDQGPAC